MRGGGMMGRGGFQSDDLKGKIYDRRLYGHMFRYVKPYAKWVILSFFILMLVAASEMVLPLIQRSAIDDHIVSNKTVAIFDDAVAYQQFMQRYSYLKFKPYSHDGKNFVIINTKDRNRLDALELKSMEDNGVLSQSFVYQISPRPEVMKILADNGFTELKQPAIREGKFIDGQSQSHPDSLKGPGKHWMRVADDEILISRESLNLVPTQDRIKLREEAGKSLVVLALIFFGIIVLRAVSSYVQSVITAYYSQMAMNDLRHDVFEHMQKMPVQYFDKNPVGRLVTRVTNDIRAIDEMLASGVITIIQDVILIIGIVVLMLVLNWQLALVSFAILPFVIWTISIYRKKTRVVYREVRKYLAQLNATLAEHIAGQKIIQLFNQYFHKRDEFSHINQVYYTTAIRQLRLFAFFRPIIHVSSQFAVALIIWYGGGQILRNAITIGLLMAFTQYVGKLFEPINQFSEKFNVLQGALAGAERIFDLMDQDPDDYRASLASKLRFEGEIEFQNVWLAYNPGEWVLKDISFRVRPGEKVALVGHTGSGKTSIVSLLMGFYPYQKGRILIDGKPLQSYSLEDLRSNIGIVQQDVFIFSGDIKENIALSNQKLSAEEIERVAKYVNADRFIQNLPQKYDEPVMERGATLSTGQRQLIAFARVLAYDPAIFVLDEATSNIDTETEILIQDALEKLMEHRTSIMIAHRLSTIQHVDRIIVLHKGEIVEEGSHFDLLDKQGLYYDLYRLQYT